MSDKDYAPLSLACVRALIDKQYDKRKAAATEIEKYALLKYDLLNDFANILKFI
jgi:vacuole morphology and inheritance protein 14